jgi:glycine/D-amino acid oxidase-like deaminating enzyme
MFQIDWQSPHLWRKTSKQPQIVRPALKGDIEVDVAVVGGGFTGLSPALVMAEAGMRVAVLEGNEIGSAASGRNNGLVIPHHSKASPSEIMTAFGPVHGERYNTLVAGAAKTAFDLMRRHGIDCDAVENGWIQPAHSPQALARVRRFYEEWKAFGSDVEWLDAEAVTEAVGSRYHGGWLAREGGHINPFALAQGLATAADQAGVWIYENTKVSGLTPDGGRWRLATPDGTVLAGQVLLASNALTGKLWPGLGQAVIPMQVYQAATAPVSGNLRAKILRDNPAVSDTRRDIRAFHYDTDFRIVTGGTLTVWNDARRRGMAQTQAMLAKAFPELGSEPKLEEYWEGVFGVVPDRKPRLMRLAPGVVFAGIYSGRGVALSIALGQQVGAWLAGNIADADMPLEVTDLRTVPFHPVAVQVARRIHPWHRIEDRFS